jgi:putative ABC transport system substrate-binding protein
MGLIVALAWGMLAVPLAATAQPVEKVRRVGALVATSQGDAFAARDWESFRHTLHTLGWVEGHNIAFEFRFAEGQPERFPALATELVQLPVDVLVAGGNAATRAAKHATSSIPIVLMTGDPVGEGFVASLAQPGGNITGVGGLVSEVDGKRLELLKETVPSLSRMAVWAKPEVPRHRRVVQDLAVLGRSLGVELHGLELRSPDDFESAFAAMTQAGAEALLLLPDPLVFGPHAGVITALALQHRLPAIYPGSTYVEAGGLMSYGVRRGQFQRHATIYVDKILKGAKPADLPVEQPMKFELVINLKTAKALGMTLPPSLLLLADEVIQ